MTGGADRASRASGQPRRRPRARCNVRLKPISSPSIFQRWLRALEIARRELEIAQCAGCGAQARKNLDGTWWLSSKCLCTDDDEVSS